MVGFIAKTKTENAKSIEVFLLADNISFKTIKEKIITGKSGLGDCENKSKMGTKHNCIQLFFSIIQNRYTINRTAFILKKGSEKFENPA